jgi:N-acetylneuraminic acid mutarotase
MDSLRQGVLTGSGFSQQQNIYIELGSAAQYFFNVGAFKQ